MHGTLQLPFQDYFVHYHKPFSVQKSNTVTHHSKLLYLSDTMVRKQYCMLIWVSRWVKVTSNIHSIYNRQRQFRTRMWHIYVLLLINI